MTFIPNKSRSAFTLVEIMIVMAILGIIIAIAMPAYIRAREVSRARACQANLAKIDGAIKWYAGEQKLDREDPVNLDDLVMENATGYLRSVPRCPSNGEYVLTIVGETPVCTIGANQAAPYAPHQIETPVPNQGAGSGSDSGGGN